MNETKHPGRRRFIGRLSTIGAAFGSAALGLVPELSHAARATTTNPNEPGNPYPPATPAPQSTPLSATEQAQLYSSALNDADVLLLTSTLAEPGRLDPPTEGARVTIDANNATTSIVIPVVSYASGAKIAIVYYGAVSLTAPETGRVDVPTKAMVSNTGAVTVAGGGAAVPSNRPEWNEAFFAYNFPEEYQNWKFPRRASGNARRTSGSPGPVTSLLTGWRMTPARAVSIFGNCDRIWRGCINTPIVSGSIAFFSGVACLTLGLMAAGALVVTVGGAVVAAPALGIVISVCATASAAYTAMVLTLANCNLTYGDCIDDVLNVERVRRS